MTVIEYCLCVTVALMLALGQFLFKLSAIRWGEQGGGLLGLISAPFIAALIFYGIATLLWVYVLRSVPLSKAYLFVLAGAALVPIMAYMAFNEPLSWSFWAGFSLILVGLYVASS